MISWIIKVVYFKIGYEPEYKSKGVCTTDIMYINNTGLRNGKTILVIEKRTHKHISYVCIKTKNRKICKEF